MNSLLELIKAARTFKNSSDTKASSTGIWNNHTAFAKYQTIDLTIDDLHKILDKLGDQAVETLSKYELEAILERLDEVSRRIDNLKAKAIVRNQTDDVDPSSFKFLKTGADVKMFHIYILQSITAITYFYDYIISQTDMNVSQYQDHADMMRDSEWYNSLDEELLDTALEEIEESLDKGVEPADTKAYAYFLEKEKTSPLF